MEAEQILKALRCCLAGLCDERCPLFGETSNCEKTLMIQSADLIESLQSRIAELEKQLAAKEAVNQAYSATVSLMKIDKSDAIQRAESAEKQLAASQRREQAAVEDLESFMRESNELRACTYCGIDQSWGCSLHKTSSMCMPKWRGPQDGKGEPE